MSGSEQIGLLEVDRVDLLDRHELLDLDRAVALALEAFSSSSVMTTYWSFDELVAPNGVVALDLVAAHGADVLLTQAPLVLCMEHG